MAYDDFDVEQYKKEWAEKREKLEVLGAWHLSVHANCGVDLPYGADSDYIGLTEYVWNREERKNEVLIPESLERLKKVAQFARTQNVLFKKEYDHSDFELVVILHGGYEVTYSIAREAVCERKVIGTRKIEARVIPAHEEEIVEWECKPVSLLK